MAKAPATKGPRKSVGPLKQLTPEDRSALTKAARTAIDEEEAQVSRDAFYAAELERMRRENVPADQIVRLTMDFAPFITFAMLDGVQFFHGYTYDVPHKQACVLMEQMQRSWRHQDEIDGRSRFNAYRKPANTMLGPRHAGMPTVGANGAVVMPADV